MSSISIPAWELFDRTFKEGDDVIVVMDDDSWAWGQLKDPGPEGVLLERGTLTKNVFWDEIRFMCHDGFPVKKLKGADGSASIIRLPSQRGRVRTLLRRLGLKELIFSDPFYIGGIVKASLFNEGNQDPIHFATDDEEVLELVAPDGAVAHLWDLKTVWHAQ